MQARIIAIAAGVIPQLVLLLLDIDLLTRAHAAGSLMYLCLELNAKQQVCVVDNTKQQI